MAETSDILEAFSALTQEGTPSALATVVRVSGSSYRRPGARLLAAADGRSWGSISGGCLERDVLRKLRNLTAPILVRYDTSDDDTAAPGVALGCQGLIDIFLEPLTAESPGPILFLRRAQVDRQSTRVATIVSSSDSNYPVAVRLPFTGGGEGILFEAFRCIQTTSYLETTSFSAFVEHFAPPQRLILFGSGPDLRPVIALAQSLGWHVTVVTSQLSPALNNADEVCRSTDDEPLAGVTIPDDAAVVLMTHNYARDLQIAPHLLNRPLKYLGILGPRRRAERLVLESRGIPADALSRIHAPVGLDLGADTPESIALSIIAEVQAVSSGRRQMSLRDRTGPIYPDTHIASAKPYAPNSCPLSA